MIYEFIILAESQVLVENDKRFSIVVRSYE